MICTGGRRISTDCGTTQGPEKGDLITQGTVLGMPRPEDLAHRLCRHLIKLHCTILLICTGGRQILTDRGTNEGPEKGDVVTEGTVLGISAECPTREDLAHRLCQHLLCHQPCSI